MLVKDLATLLGSASWESSDATAGDRDISAVAPLESAGPADLSFVSGGKAARSAAHSQAGCLLVPLDFENATGRTIIRTRDPRAAAARAIAQLHPEPLPPPGVHPSAVIGADVTLGDGVSVGPLTSIGNGAHIGAGTSIAAGCVIEAGVRIGDHCTIHPRVTIYSRVTIGNHVVLHAGAVLGADGFGFVFSAGRYEKFPQVGRVEIADHVEIGANSCIDRAALGVTIIGEGTKLDNMVHIAHNCQIGKHVVIAAQTGLSGGVVVEEQMENLVAVQTSPVVQADGPAATSTPVAKTSKATIRILVADDHPIIRDGLRKLLTLEDDFEVVGEAGDGHEVLAKVQSLNPNVVLLDLRMPNMDGLTAMQALQQSGKQTRVIVLTASDDKNEFVHAMKLGCSGIVLKQTASDLIVKSIRKVHSGEIWLDSTTTAAVMRQFSTRFEPAPTSADGVKRTPLSAREREIVALVAQGFKNKELADRLFISEQTVKNHLHNIFDKLNVSDRLELALYAVHNGLHIGVEPTVRPQKAMAEAAGR